MKYIIILLIFLLIPLTSADTTFFDNPDDAFIMGSGATGGVTAGTTDGTSGGGCLTDWSCSSWSSCVDGIQIRNCTKEKADCYADLKKKPAENKSCSIETGNNTGQEENLIYQSPLMNSKNITIVVIGLMVIMGVIVFFLFNKHRKRRYYHHGY